MHGDYQSARCDQKADTAASGRTRGGGLFPCAAIAFTRSSRPSSSRRAARWRRRVAAKDMVQVVMGVSSWMALGGPAKCPQLLQSPTTAAHELAIAHIERSSSRWIRLIESSPDLIGCGRRGPAVARQLDALRAWLEAFPDVCRDYGLVRGGPAPMGAVAVKPHVPERMALPTRGGTFDLAAWLPEKKKADFLQPKRIRRHHPAFGTPAAPRSRIHTRDWPGF